MKLEITQPMTTLKEIDFMHYCTREHPNEQFREQCQLLRYAVSGDAIMFKENIDKLMTNPDKNFIPFYPAIDDESKVEGMDLVGPIMDGSLYFG